MKIEENISLAPYTTFKVGGVARYFVAVSEKEELINVLTWAKGKKLPIFILGGGSNVLVSDLGFDGLVVKIQIKGISIDGSEVFVSAGESLAKLLQFSASQALSGIEWAIGIPGTIGGAIRGNAGAFGGSISSSIKEVEALETDTLNVKKLSREKCFFEYRDSIFKKDSKLIILSAVLSMKHEKEDEVKKIILENVKSRANSCKCAGKSAGCFFKNIPWDSIGISKEELILNFPEFKKVEDRYKLPAGFLIQEAGLAGINRGEAFVSEENCNYILNKGDASSGDIKSLVELCKRKVYEKFKIKLEEEVQLIGKFKK